VPRPLGFGPDARIGSRKDFQRVFSDGRKLAGRNLVLWYYSDPTRTGPAARRPRLGLSVSAKLGNAVTRNRLKRLAREAFRLRRGGLAPSSDLVVYLRPGCRWKGLADAEADLSELCAKAGLLAR